MTISKIGKCLSVFTSVLATVTVGLLAICCFHILGAGSRGVELEGQSGEYFKYLAIPALITLIFAILSVAVCFVARKDKRRQKRSNREILSVYEAIYRIRSLEPEADKKFRKIIKTRNIIDLISCQLSLMCFVFALDYLIFFEGFNYESIAADLKVAAIFVIPLATLGAAILVARWLISEKKSGDALKIIDGDKAAKKVIAVLKKTELTESFFKFKAKLNGIRLIKALMLGIGFGLAAGSVAWILTKRCLVSLDNLVCILIGGATLLITFGIFFLTGRKNDMKIARQLDDEFDLMARVQTMVEFSEDYSELATLQRLDTEKTLSEVSAKSCKFKKLWVYILAVVLAVAVLAIGFVTEDLRDYVPPVQIEPFELSPLQESGLIDIIDQVEKSELEEEFKAPMVAELKALLEKLRGIKTKPDMLVAMTESMAIITDITYDSSTATEVLNALWDAGDYYLKHLAVMLDTSSWNSPNWGDFAEKNLDYREVLLGDSDKSENAVVGKERLKTALSGMLLKIDITLRASGVGEEDEIYIALDDLFNNRTFGLAPLLATLDYISEDEARELLKSYMDIHSEAIYNAISLNRKNAIVGENALTRLSSLFGVPRPAFERPDFVKNGEDPSGNHIGSGSNDKESGGGEIDGAPGRGESFGSTDLVLDPLTGNYVEIGTLMERYYPKMYEKLQNGSYTEEQKEAIMKYFALLYDATNKEEGK